MTGVNFHRHRGLRLKRNHLKVGAVLACAAGLAYGAVTVRTVVAGNRSTTQTSLAAETLVATSSRTQTAAVPQPQSSATTLATGRTPACTVISSLPFSITTSGRYCYAANLVSSSFYGVRIGANYVDLDCRGFSTATSMGRTGGTDGISVINGARHATIRNCKVIGFDRGITAFGGSTYAQILNNHVDSSISIGIGAWGDYAQIAGNRVSNTHPEDPTQYAEGIDLYPASPQIAARGQVVTNNLVVNTYGGAQVVGIYVSGSTAPVISGNSILELHPAAGGGSMGLWLANWAQGANTTAAQIVGNQIVSRHSNLMDAYLQYGQAERCDNNITIGALSNFPSCAASSGNQAIP